MRLRSKDSQPSATITSAITPTPTSTISKKGKGINKTKLETKPKLEKLKNETDPFKILEQFQEKIVEQPEIFLNSHPVKEKEELCELIKNATKTLYEISSKSVTSGVNLGPLPDLLVEGFDVEQIWEEIQLRNLPLLSSVKNKINEFEKLAEKMPDDEESEMDVDSKESKMDKKKLAKLKELNDKYKESNIEEEFGLNGDMDEDIDEDMDEDEEDRDENEMLEDGEEDEEDEEGGEDDESEEESEMKNKKKEKGKRKGEDAFFSIAEMEDFIKDAEGNEIENDLNDDIDYFGEIPSEDEDDEDDEENEDEEDEFGDFNEDDDDEDGSKQKKVKAGEMTYNDYFDPPKEDKKKKNKKKFKGLLDDEDDGSEDEEGLSKLEAKNERMKKLIQMIEDESIADKHWSLKGEVTSKSRPLNSLLEEDIDFEHASKTVPVITEEVTLSLEERIKKRIVDGVFDDVERKFEEDLDYKPKPRIELDQEKSKKNLGEIYEDEFMKLSTGKDEKSEQINKKHKAVEMMFQKLCSKLDALSNFHYTPKTWDKEVEIISHVPAMALEEKIPSALSDASRLAPQEVFHSANKGVVKGETEVTSEEKKRLRAKKKASKKAEKKREKKTEKLVENSKSGLGNKYSKEKMLKDIKGGKTKNVIMGKESDDKTNYSSSNAVFARLEKEKAKEKSKK